MVLMGWNVGAGRRLGGGVREIGKEVDKYRGS